MIHIGILCVNNSISLYYLFMATFIIGICSAMFDPTILSSIPLIVDGDKNIIKLQSRMELIRNLVSVFGPIFGGFLLTIVSPAISFIINGLSFLISAIMEMFIKFKIQTYEKVIIKDIVNDFKLGVEFIKKNYILRNLMPLFAIINMIGLPILQVIVPLLISKNIGNSLSIGFFYSLLGVGGILGALLYSKIPFKKLNIILIGISIFTFSTMLLLIAWNTIIFILSALAYGFTSPIIQIATNMIFLENVPNEMRGKVFSFRRMFSQAFMPIGLFGIGYITQKISINISIFISIIILLISLIKLLKLINLNKNIQTKIIKE
ncbi:MFS transporter [Caminicella sporogenes]|uniref:MFS transporter n=1 Tax=Caminicella sporogenes TaxID=166485 RepID=UPI002540669D|nr:MFS transporter [Caminicella sporogenes]WIF94259.1 MFS transporter [Caminicella sporogenes]